MPPVVTNSACSDKQAHLAHRLHEVVPQGAKLALCFDPEGDLDGCETIVDTAGRAWRMLTYQEDDLAFRLAIRELEVAGWHAEAPVLLRVAMPTFVPLTHRIELSFLGDVFQRVEGEPIDLRTDAVVTCHTEPVVWPDSLQTYAARISRDLPGFVEGYWRLRRAIGRDRPLGRHHVAAVLLLAKSRDLEYRDLELSHAYPAELIARFLTLAATHRLGTEDERLLWDVLTAPRAFVVSSGKSTPATLFYHKARKRVGILGVKDVVVFDEVAREGEGEPKFDAETIDTLKMFMPSGQYTRDNIEFTSPCSVVLGGNINTDTAKRAPVEDYNHLFAPLPAELRHDTAFLDRIHAYLPGWEIPKIAPENYATGYGFISDYLAEIFRLLRLRNFQTYLVTRIVFEGMTGRNQDAIQKTAAGLLKLLYPHRAPENIEPEELQFCLELAVEMRRRVTDQLRVIAPKEFTHTACTFHVNGQD